MASTPVTAVASALHCAFVDQKARVESLTSALRIETDPARSVAIWKELAPAVELLCALEEVCLLAGLPLSLVPSTRIDLCLPLKTEGIAVDLVVDVPAKDGGSR